ncbi:unnamed protein product [Prunus armeniaca]|uniref:S1 motif domain-containing protein n=1 Tax=Prunus armeniaca TaxID=36596 RepID=A0A6J5VA81_PRUAR|nr:unnamed protein product [Prunus armeniaca]
MKLGIVCYTYFGSNQPQKIEFSYWILEILYLVISYSVLSLEAEMLKCSPPPSRTLSNGGKKVKSIIEETGVDAIDTQEDGIVKITARDLASIEKNCEIKSIAPYGVFVEIAPGREGLCHISELSSNWLAKAEDAFKVGDHIDVKLLRYDLLFLTSLERNNCNVNCLVNEKGQLRLSHRALLPDTDPEKASAKQPTGDAKDVVGSQETSDKGLPKKMISIRKGDSAEKYKLAQK